MLRKEVSRELPVDKDLCVRNCTGDESTSEDCLIYLPFNFHFFFFISFYEGSFF